MGEISHGLNSIAGAYLLVCGVCALYILWDQQKRPAPMMRIMLWVWPVNALWAGPLGVWAYRAIGVEHAGKTTKKMDMEGMHHDMPGMKMSNMDMEGMHHDMPGMKMSNMNMEGMHHDMPGMKMSNMDMEGMHHDMPGMKMSDMKMSGTQQAPSWKSVTAGTLHCGAGCTLADLVGPWLFRLAPFALFGSEVYGEWTLDYVLALMTGVIFQYAGLAAMSTERGPKLWWRAFRVDVLSLSAWQVGMYGWMGLVIFGMLGPLSPQEPVFWLMMQISMACGFVTAWPMNWVLIRTGVKSAM